MNWDETLEAYHSREDSAHEALREERAGVLRAAVKYLADHEIDPIDAEAFVAELERVFTGPFPAGSLDWVQSDFDRCQQAFDTYITEGDFTQLGPDLSRYVGHARDLLLRLGMTKPWAVAFLADVMLAALFHVARNGASEAFSRHSDIDAVFRTFSSLEGIPDADGIDGTLRAEHQRVLRRETGQVAITLPTPITLAGYDPRFPNKAKRDAYYGDVMERARKRAEPSLMSADLVTKAASKPKGVLPDLQENYPQAKAAIYRDFHDPQKRYDLLLIDFAWLPELADQGHVIPLERFTSRSELELLIQKAIPRGVDASIWPQAITHLATGGNDRLYCLPAWLNFHVVARRGEQNMDSLKNVLENGASTCVLQGKASACSTYALYAHFAYEACVPIAIEASSETGLRAVTVGFRDPKALDAFAKYLARRALFLREPEAWETSTIDHERELELLDTTTNLWDVAFSSELSPRLRQTPPMLFVPPAKNHVTGTYLCSLGGYGLAVSRQARDPRRAFDYIDHIASLMHDDADKRNGMFGDLENHLPEVVPSRLQQFLTVHTRPRLPFWTQVEEAISSCVEELEDDFRSTDNKEHHIGNIGSFDATCSAYRTFLEGHRGLRTLARLERRIQLTAENHGWHAKVLERDSSTV